MKLLSKLIHLLSHLPKTCALGILMSEFQCIEQRGIGDLNTATLHEKWHSLRMLGKEALGMVSLPSVYYT